MMPALAVAVSRRHNATPLTNEINVTSISSRHLDAQHAKFNAPLSPLSLFYASVLSLIPGQPFGTALSSFWL